MKENRLPQSGKEGILYGSVICIITVFIMLILNIGTSFGTLNQKAVWISILKALPLIWVAAMLLESFVIGRLAGILVKCFSQASDGFNARILFNILFVVLGMSASMTVIGPLISGESFLDVLLAFPSHWPRNFCVAFWCEICLAQPAARKVMKLIHVRQEKRSKEDEPVCEA